MIFANDHEPAHVHVFGNGEAKINLVGETGGVDLVWAVGLTRAEVRRAVRLSPTTATSCRSVGPRSVADLTDAEIDAALERGRHAQSNEPRARAARYDADRDQIIVELTSGATFAFPPALVKALANVPPALLTDLSVLGAGYGLHWEDLDLDLTVPGIVAEVFATQVQLARKAGRASSAAKAAAARSNGAKGGRPRKSA